MVLGLLQRYLFFPYLQKAVFVTILIYIFTKIRKCIDKGISLHYQITQTMTTTKSKKLFLQAIPKIVAIALKNGWFFSLRNEHFEFNGISLTPDFGGKDCVWIERNDEWKSFLTIEVLLAYIKTY